MLKGVLRILTGFGVGIALLSYNVDLVLEVTAKDINRKVCEIAERNKPKTELARKKE